MVSIWYSRRTLSQLMEIIPEIPWKLYLNDVFSAINTTLDDKTVIIVKGEKYLMEAAKYLKKVDYQTIKSFISWKLLQKYGSMLKRVIKNYWFEYLHTTEGLKEIPDIEKQCFTHTNELLGNAVGQLYVNRHFSKNAKDDMDVMVKNLKKAMKEMIEKNGWMDSVTKKAAKEKLENMNAKIGFPTWILNDTMLNSYYKEVTNISRQDFLKSYILLKGFHKKKELRKIFLLPDNKIEWVSSPAVVNAMYLPSKNEITFPAGILQPPFYHYNTLPALNYGAIGYVIGHEITHAFDDTGKQYDANGNIHEWWGNKTANEFNYRKQCLVELYSKIKDKQTGLNLDGVLTIGENIADNGAIREAYKAFLEAKKGDVKLPKLEHLTAEQLFFVANGNIRCSKYRTSVLEYQIRNNVHSPTMYRLTFPLSNMKEFATAFNCKPGSKMNPLKKCVLW